MTFLGTVGRLIAFGVVVVAVAIAVVPKIVYSELPSDLTLMDFTSPTTMVVTGANSGVGLATVQHFARNPNMSIIMACRSMTKCNDAKTQIFRNLHEDVRANMLPMELDLSHKSSIEAFARKLQGEPIHVLINNAGLVGATEQLSYHKEDGVENHIRVNHLGHVYLTHCLWKNLRLAEKARIVIVSSLLGALPKNVPTLGWYKGEEQSQRFITLKMYGRSKRANLMFAAELQERYGEVPQNSGGISVVAAHPGFTHSELCKKGCKGLNELGRGLATSHLLTGSIKMTAEEGALPQAYAAVVPQGGVYLGPRWLVIGEPVIVGRLMGSWHHASFTRDESQALWTKSLAAMQIKEFGEFEIPVIGSETKAEPVQEQQEPVHPQRQEIPVREEPVHREDEPVRDESDHHHQQQDHHDQQQQQAEPEPTQVYEQSEVNDQADYDRADSQQQEQPYHGEAHSQQQDHEAYHGEADNQQQEAKHSHEHHEQQPEQHAHTEPDERNENAGEYMGGGPYREAGVF